MYEIGPWIFHHLRPPSAIVMEMHYLSLSFPPHTTIKRWSDNVILQRPGGPKMLSVRARKAWCKYNRVLLQSNRSVWPSWHPAATPSPCERKHQALLRPALIQQAGLPEEEEEQSPCPMAEAQSPTSPAAYGQGRQGPGHSTGQERN